MKRGGAFRALRGGGRGGMGGVERERRVGDWTWKGLLVDLDKTRDLS